MHRAPGGKQLASLVEVSEYEPDRVFALRMLEGALPIHARITFESTKLGTRVQVDAHGQPSGPMRLAQPLIRLNPQAPVRRLLRHAQTGARERPASNPTAALKLLGSNYMSDGKVRGPTTCQIGSYRERQQL